MLRRCAAALMLASAATGAPNWAACAHAQAATFVFEDVPRAAPPRQSHALAWSVAAVGAGLVAASFPLSDLADRRYDEYLRETDPAAIGGRFDAVVRADHLASASLVAGETLLVTAVWLRFVHRPRAPRATVAVLPDRCAVSVRF